MNKQEFLEQLFKLLEENNAAIYYTTDDDGIHISKDGEDVFVGYIPQSAN
jgi:hypothetical protein